MRPGGRGGGTPGSAGEPSRDGAAASRRGFIEETATTLGRTWAVGCRRDLQREGRPVSGGWPGTMREARALVERAFPVGVQDRRVNAITEVERELAARTAYASARTEWRRHIEPEAP